MALSLQHYIWFDANSRLNHFLKKRLTRDKERSMIIVDLPENVMVEILSWLPVNDLLQFKTVCKSWHSIISSQNFISQHLKNYYKRNDSWKNCLLVQYFVRQAELQLYELLVDESPQVLGNDVLYSMPMYGSYVCGPCEGIYYLYHYDSGGRALWNPAINELKTLPELIPKPDCPSKLTYASNEAYGFGLDPATGEYKVVVIKGHCSSNDDDDDDEEEEEDEDDDDDVKLPVSVLVYSLRTDSWRYCGDLGRAYELEENKCYMYVNGCYYWLGSFENGDEAVICFDMAIDEVKVMEVPDYAQPSCKCLAKYDDSLAFVALQKTGKNLEIWTWKESRWMKSLTVGPLPGVRNPVGHWMENRLVLEGEEGELLLLDPDTREVRDLAFNKNRWCEGVFPYIDSLVSIRGGGS